MTVHPIAIVIAVFFCVVFAIQLLVARPWFTAFMGGAPVSVLDVLNMQFRRIDANAIVKAMVATSQAGVKVSCAEVQQAALQGVDLRKISLAAIEAKKQGLDLSFANLVDAELQGQLAEKLKA